jgi:hypothetical protein
VLRIRVNVESYVMIDIYENQALALICVFIATLFAIDSWILPSTLVYYMEKGWWWGVLEGGLC